MRPISVEGAVMRPLFVVAVAAAIGLGPGISAVEAQSLDWIEACLDNYSGHVLYAREVTNAGPGGGCTSGDDDSGYLVYWSREGLVGMRAQRAFRATEDQLAR